MEEQGDGAEGEIGNGEGQEGRDERGEGEGW